MSRLWRHPLLAPLNDATAWERMIRLIRPAFSFTDVLATVTAVEQHSANLKSIWLRPNGRFRSFVPGQHVLLTLANDGTLHARCFSLSQAPRRDRLLRLTIQRQPDGLVSAAAHRLQVGQIVGLSQAQGRFVAPPGAQPLLLLSAGSGVTPMLAILQALSRTDPDRDVSMIHCGRTGDQTACAAELNALSARWPKFRLHLHHSAPQGRLCPEQLARCIPDWQQRQAMVCGPAGFSAMVRERYAGCTAQPIEEHFQPVPSTIDPTAPQQLVRYGSPEQVFTVTTGQSLLDAARQAGLQPRYGCGKGICRSCQCRKRSGSVRNLLTNVVSGNGEELIQLCISTPLSPLQLDAQGTRTRS